MKKKRLKFKYLPIAVFILALVPILTLALLFNYNLQEEPVDNDFVNDEVVESTLPVINTSKKIIYPYVDKTVKVGRGYYDYQGQEESQLKSITVHDNTYMQNTGIDFIKEETFDVVAVLDGTVTNVKQDDLVGKTIEIKHDNGYVSTYQSLSEVVIKKGDAVTQGQIIGKSGTNELDKDLGNHLHFEIYKNGQSLNPENYLDKELKEEKEN